jgi:serine/threonine-protein kinase
MILKDGSVKVADFGIARLLSVQNTLTQEALGSVHYISPEQAKGRHVDARSDIYSVGVVMYEMLTSRLPFVGESAVSVAIQHISAIPLLPRDINPDIPAGLEDITMHAMEPDLNLRFTTAEEMLNDLEDFRKNPSILFNYRISDPEDRQSLDIAEQQETRVIQRGSTVSKQNELSVRADRPAVPVKRRVPVKADLSSDEYRTAKKRSRNTSTLIGIFSIVVFLIAVVVFMWNFLLKGIFIPEDREQITIPRFINRKIEDIQSDEEYKTLYNFSISYENNDEYDAGIVFYQSPMYERQQSVLPGRKINVELIVSSGEEPPRIMPDLVGLHYADAKNQLIGLYLDLEIVEESVVSDVEKGYIVETRPAADGMISKGNTVVLVRSAGPNKRMEKVPDLVGSSMETLITAFHDLDLTPDFKEIPGSEPAGTVLIISKAGQEVEVPQVITVYVSQGPPETEPPITETPTPEPIETITPTPESPNPDNPTPEPPDPDNPTPEPPDPYYPMPPEYPDPYNPQPEDIGISG